MKGEWFRFRFRANAEDPRPVKFPPPGPYWVTGYDGSGEWAYIVAYIRPSDALRDYWPDAAFIEQGTAHDAIEFSERFPRPDWWTP